MPPTSKEKHIPASQQSSAKQRANMQRRCCRIGMPRIQAGKRKLLPVAQRSTLPVKTIFAASQSTSQMSTFPFWEGLDKHLDKFDYFIWSEKPLKPEWNFCTGSDGISRLWSHQYGFCGCPDLIGYRNSLAILVDFKTSNQPYCRWFPDKKDPSTRQNFTGWSKLNKCALQLAAYGQAAQETLDVHIDCAQILVSTPEIDQSFLFHGDDLTKYKTKWLQKVRRYRELKAEESQALEEGQ